jgi:hypothetical protein
MISFPKIKVLLMCLFIFLSTSVFYAQSKIKGNRDVKTEQTDVAPFKAISIGDDLEVILIKSTYPSVTLEADSNLLSVIQYQVNDSILNFQVTKRVTSSREFKVLIRYTDVLNSIILNGDVDVETENTLDLPELSLTLNDDAKIEASIIADKFSLQNNNDSSLKFSTNCILKVETKSAFIDLKNNSNNILDINAEELHITTHDNSEINIEGYAYSLELTSTNSSRVKGKNFLTNIATINVSEKSDVEINVTETVSIDASGSSIIELYGEPKVTIDNFTNQATLNKKEL